MNAIGEPPQKPARKRRRRDRIIAVVGGVAVLVMVWLSEVPQERIGDWGLERFFGTGVQFEYGSALGALHIEKMLLFSTIDERGVPVIQISDLVIDYDLFPGDGRWINDVTLGAITVRLDATDPEKPNFRFINDLLAVENTEPTPKAIVPRTVRVDNISLALAGTPSGGIEGESFPSMGLSIAGLSAKLDLDGERVTHAELNGDGVTTHTWTGKGDHTTESNDGHIEIVYEGNADSSQLDTIQVNLPGLLEVLGTASSVSTGGERRNRIDFATLNIDGAGYDSDALPLAYDRITASGTTFDSNDDSPWSIPCSITGLRVGTTEEPLYDGDLNVAISRREGDDIELTIALDGGQQIDARFNPRDGSAVASVDAWTPEMLEAAVPPAYRNRLAELPDFSEFSLTLAASAPKVEEWIDESTSEPLQIDFSVFGDAELPQKSKGSGLRIEAAGTGALTDAGLDSASAHGGVIIAGERAEFELDSVDDSIASTMTFDDVNVARWLKLALGDIPIGSDSGVLNGTITYDGTLGSGELTLSRGKDRVVITTTVSGSNAPDDPLIASAKIESGGTADLNYTAMDDEWNGGIEFASFDIGRLVRLIGLESDLVGLATGHVNVSRGPDASHGEVSLRLKDIQSDDWSLNPNGPIELATAFESDVDFQSIRGGATVVSLSDETIVSMDRWDFAQDPFEFKTKAKAALDLGKHGEVLGIEGWGGKAEVVLSVTHQQDRWQAPARVVWEDPKIPGLEDVRAGSITFEGNLSRLPDATATTLTKGHVTWGEHTQVSLPRASVETSPFGVLGDVQIESDLTILIALGVLRYVDGAMNAEGEVRLVDGNPQFDLTVNADVVALELPDGMAAVHTANLSGQVAYDGTYGGTGVLRADSATSAGALLTEIGGNYAFTGDMLSLSDVTGQTYGGAVLGQGQVELLTGTYNGEFQADITRLDLDRFTKEFEPGEFRLTGISKADVYARWSTEGLSGAQFVMTSTDGFSLDRETVETMLTSRALPDQWGMRWIKKRINKKMIGDDPQRLFDSARVDLELRQTDGEPDRLLGPITLKSETLDFNIDWAIDVNAIYAAMESDLAAVENFSAGTVQSEDQ